MDDARDAADLADIRRLAIATSAYLRAPAMAEQGMECAPGFAEEIEAAARAAVDGLHRPASRSVQGLRHMPRIAANRPAQTEALIEAALQAFWPLAWSTFYAEDEWSRPFLGEFATGEAIGPSGPLRTEAVILGLCLIGPDTFYPPHAHAAEEIYLCLSGATDFQIGAGDPFRAVAPGDAVCIPSQASHAMRTGSEPFFSVYAWRGDVLAPSWYCDDMGDPTSPPNYPPRAGP